MKEIKNVVQNYHLFGFFQVGFQINGDKVSLSGDRFNHNGQPQASAGHRRPRRPRPKNSRKLTSSDILVPVLVLILAVLVQKFSKIVILGHPRLRPRPHPRRPERTRSFRKDESSSSSDVL